MKFSEKGLKRLLDVAFDGDEFYQHDALQINFYPEDFKGAIVLSIEEAKEVSLQLYRLAQLYSLQILELDSDKKLIKPLAKTYESLNEKIVQAMKTKRIEQSEMSKQSTQCENVSKKDEKIITLTVEQAEKK